MHIPDGYLSPSTCAVAFLIAMPFWWVAQRRVHHMLHTRLVPLLAVVSAFSFVIMMFNLPLPGGTTGHAVGMAVAAIVLGPWAAILAISVALFIQAVFFGDGGITAIGANCVNMAIVGPLVAYGLYRLIAAGSQITAKRRVVAAAIAGYVAINISALLAAVEFGIQPLLFTDPVGTPLYAPYTLSVAVPAMLLGHLTFAGIAEAVISGGIVAYLQKANPDLLRFTAPPSAALPSPAMQGGWRPVRALWLGMTLIMLLSPLGLLAVGTAWGEWGAGDFQDAAARAEITRASGDVAPPAGIPSGMQRLEALWTAPVPDYAPSFMQNASVGYILSAVMGSGLILLMFYLLTRLFSPLGYRRFTGRH
ncbi:cobalt transporter CbiM [Acerihabitans sp. TG2]|uniref:cobalt transporter CbiM n=1 Tax=Acerihabitans sp. TG2 TaxID=3096008 RepID=UPI002B22F8B9|nr:cobalt transporter CbiM [Acerihabitans sp. TG2]MEA9391389.1 cobalt transporter CbiM [Acerihabitans sp. TG2]